MYYCDPLNFGGFGIVIQNIFEKIASEIDAKPNQVIAVAKLLSEGSTVPFIARYRKEATGGLDDTKLRQLETRLTYLKELDERRQVVLRSIEEQGKLTPQLKVEIEGADTKTRLEDLYLPYKPKRRTKAQIAKEAGLEPLAELILVNCHMVPDQEAVRYLNPEKEIIEIKHALDGARAILMERFYEDADLRKDLRSLMFEHGEVISKVVSGKEKEGEKFSDYFDYSELISKIPSHRALALFRGRSEGVLSLELRLSGNSESRQAPACYQLIAEKLSFKLSGSPRDKWLWDTIKSTWDMKMSLSIEIDLFLDLRSKAEGEAIRVFASNLKDLLLAAPAGMRSTMGLDPGYRSGVKVCVVSSTGKLLDTTVIYPHAPQNEWDMALTVLGALCARHGVELISVGNGTASRETDKLVSELLKRYPELKVNKVIVSEAGASVYSASELAAKEFPGLDVTLRGAVSIARRLQDPLAELVKIEPKAIGVGQYQHDVDQYALARTLNAVVEDCVNGVGVNLNTASPALLTRVSGLSNALAENIVIHRDQKGPFRNRKELMLVPRFGEKTFEQSAGFLRIPDGETPLDGSAVHPEAYPVVERLLAKVGKEIKDVIGNVDLLRTIKPAELVDDKFGEPTIIDILKELEKPGRDPRPEFKTAKLSESVSEVEHLKPGMLLEGTVTNVTNFGAFVDIGVHQDGLVHISCISDKFIKDPREAVKAGDIVKVRVMEIDLPRKRISLTMKLNDSTPASVSSQVKQRSNSTKGNDSYIQKENVPFNTLGNAFAALLQKK